MDGPGYGRKGVYCILVVKDTDLPRHKRARELRKMIAPYKYPLDLLVYSRDEFEKEKNVAGTLAYQAVREGILLSRSPHQVFMRSGDAHHRSRLHPFPISSIQEDMCHGSPFPLHPFRTSAHQQYSTLLPPLHRPAAARTT